MTTLTSEKSKRPSQYKIVLEVPTHFRSYPESVRKFYVRGLYYDEAINLARYVESEQDYEQLIAIYTDVIRTDEPSFTLYDLEFVDFQALMAVSSVMSARQYKWNVSLPCVDPECKGRVVGSIVLDDLDFDESLTDVTFPIEMTLGGETHNIAPLTMRDIIAIDRLPSELQSEASFAAMIKDKESTLNYKLDVIKYAMPYEVEDLKRLDDELDIDIKPITKKCKVCGKEAKIFLNLNQLKVYP
jgi:hypothetical protein